MPYKAIGRSFAIANYAAPVAFSTITGSHKMSRIDHIHSETEMLQVEDHLNLMSAQYLVHCLDTKNVLSPYHQDGSFRPR